MRFSKMRSGRALLSAVAAACTMSAAVAHAEDISGTIVRTLMLSENTRLIGDVTCNVTAGPCIAFGAPNIVLFLNGFSITGPGDAATGCGGRPRVRNRPTLRERSSPLRSAKTAHVSCNSRTKPCSRRRTLRRAPP